MTDRPQLSEPEVRHLIAIAMAYDGRQAGDANVIAWAEGARRGRWTFEEAAEAIHEHYHRTDRWIMPSHISDLIRAARNDRANREAAPMLTPAEAERRAGIVAKAFQALTEGPSEGPLSRKCPWCGSPRGERCVRPSRRGPVQLNRIHDARKEAS